VVDGGYGGGIRGAMNGVSATDENDCGCDAAVAQETLALSSGAEVAGCEVDF